MYKYFPGFVLVSLLQISSAAFITVTVHKTGAAPSSVPTGSTGGGGIAETSYQCHKGTDFPPQNEWVSFDQLKNTNYAQLSGNGNGGTVADEIISAIQTVSNNAGIDPRIVLAMVMQETGGELTHVGDANKSHGLMQVQVDSPVQCSSGGCTQNDITGMIQQGVNGHTGDGSPQSPGIAYWLQSTQNNVPVSLRSYNTGSVPNPSDYSQVAGVGTSSYVSDVANRLQGLAGIPSPQELQSLCGFPPAAGS